MMHYAQMSNPILRCHRYHGPIVRFPAFWCDRVMSSDRCGRLLTTLGSVAADCRQKVADSMNSRAQFCDSTCADQMHLAERELSAFMHAVTQLFGPEEAKLSAEDWFDQLIGSPPLSTSRNWRAVTIAASARLANRLTGPQRHRPDRRIGARIRRFLTRESAARRAR
jgi:hypothetical protein